MTLIMAYASIRVAHRQYYALQGVATVAQTRSGSFFAASAGYPGEHDLISHFL